jgi:hypothetical protein
MSRAFSKLEVVFCKRSAENNFVNALILFVRAKSHFLKGVSNGNYK